MIEKLTYAGITLAVVAILVVCAVRYYNGDDIKYECARAQRAGAQCVYVPHTGR